MRHTFHAFFLFSRVFSFSKWVQRTAMYVLNNCHPPPATLVGTEGKQTRWRYIQNRNASRGTRSSSPLHNGSPLTSSRAAQAQPVGQPPGQEAQGAAVAAAHPAHRPLPTPSGRRCASWLASDFRAPCGLWARRAGCGMWVAFALKLDLFSIITPTPPQQSVGSPHAGVAGETLGQCLADPPFGYGSFCRQSTTSST